MAEALTSEKVTVQSATKQIRDNFTQLRVRSGEVEYVGEGMDNIVFRAKHDYLFRFAKDAGTSMQNEKNAITLNITKGVKLTDTERRVCRFTTERFFFLDTRRSKECR